MQPINEDSDKPFNEDSDKEQPACGCGAKEFIDPVKADNPVRSREHSRTAIW